MEVRVKHTAQLSVCTSLVEKQGKQVLYSIPWDTKKYWRSNSVSGCVAMVEPLHQNHGKGKPMSKTELEEEDYCAPKGEVLDSQISLLEEVKVVEVIRFPEKATAFISSSMFDAEKDENEILRKPNVVGSESPGDEKGCVILLSNKDNVRFFSVMPKGLSPQEWAPFRVWQKMKDQMELDSTHQERRGHFNFKIKQPSEQMSDPAKKNLFTSAVWAECAVEVEELRVETFNSEYKHDGLMKELEAGYQASHKHKHTDVVEDHRRFQEGLSPLPEGLKFFAVDPQGSVAEGAFAAEAKKFYYVVPFVPLKLGDFSTSKLQQYLDWPMSIYSHSKGPSFPMIQQDVASACSLVGKGQVAVIVLTKEPEKEPNVSIALLDRESVAQVPGGRTAFLSEVTAGIYNTTLTVGVKAFCNAQVGISVDENSFLDFCGSGKEKRSEVQQKKAFEPSEWIERTAQANLNHTVGKMLADANKEISFLTRLRFRPADELFYRLYIELPDMVESVLDYASTVASDEQDQQRIELVRKLLTEWPERRKKRLPAEEPLPDCCDEIFSMAWRHYQAEAVTTKLNPGGASSDNTFEQIKDLYYEYWLPECLKLNTISELYLSGGKDDQGPEGARKDHHHSAVVTQPLRSAVSLFNQMAFGKVFFVEDSPSSKRVNAWHEGFNDGVNAGFKEFKESFDDLKQKQKDLKKTEIQDLILKGAGVEVVLTIAKVTPDQIYLKGPSNFIEISMEDLEPFLDSSVYAIIQTENGRMAIDTKLLVGRVGDEEDERVFRFEAGKKIKSWIVSGLENGQQKSYLKAICPFGNVDNKPGTEPPAGSPELSSSSWMQIPSPKTIKTWFNTDRKMIPSEIDKKSWGEKEEKALAIAEAHKMGTDALGGNTNHNDMINFYGKLVASHSLDLEKDKEKIVAPLKRQPLVVDLKVEAKNKWLGARTVEADVQINKKVYSKRKIEELEDYVKKDQIAKADKLRVLQNFFKKKNLNVDSDEYKSMRTEAQRCHELERVLATETTARGYLVAAHFVDGKGAVRTAYLIGENVRDKDGKGETKEFSFPTKLRLFALSKQTDVHPCTHDFMSQLRDEPQTATAQLYPICHQSWEVHQSYREYLKEERCACRMIMDLKPQGKMKTIDKVVAKKFLDKFLTEKEKTELKEVQIKEVVKTLYSIMTPKLRAVHLPTLDKVGPDQEVITIFDCKITALGGPAGAGKTTITHIIARIALELGMKVLYVAPTNEQADGFHSRLCSVSGPAAFRIDSYSNSRKKARKDNRQSGEGKRVEVGRGEGRVTEFPAGADLMEVKKHLYRQAGSMEMGYYETFRDGCQKYYAVIGPELKLVPDEDACGTILARRTEFCDPKACKKNGGCGFAHHGGQIHHETNQDKLERIFKHHEKKGLLLSMTVDCCLLNASTSGQKYDLVFMDEAQAVPDPSILSLVHKVHKKNEKVKILPTGDPFQLPPLNDNKEQAALNVGFLRRLYFEQKGKGGCAPMEDGMLTVLDTVLRTSVPDLARVWKTLYRPMGFDINFDIKVQKDARCKREQAVWLLDVHGKGAQEQHTPPMEVDTQTSKKSYWNPKEHEATKGLLKAIQLDNEKNEKEGKAKKTVLVISVYAATVKMIQNVIRELGSPPEFKAETVNVVASSQADITILMLTRTTKNRSGSPQGGEFLSRAKVLTMATRAKQALYIVGNSSWANQCHGNGMKDLVQLGFEIQEEYDNAKRYDGKEPATNAEKYFDEFRSEQKKEDRSSQVDDYEVPPVRPLVVHPHPQASRKGKKSRNHWGCRTGTL